MAATHNRWPYRATLLAWLLLIASLAACSDVDCASIGTTGCAGTTLYHVYDRPGRD